MVIYICVLIIFKQDPAIAQIVHTADFTQKLESFGLELVLENDQYWHVSPVDPDLYFNYDLVLVSDDGKIELRIVIQPIEANEAAFASMRVIGKLSSIATNDQGPWINTRPLSGYDSKRLFNADEAMKGSFRPKQKFSDRGIAKFTSILQEENCLVVVYTLVNDPQDFPEPDANRMRFIESREAGSPVD